MCLVEVVRCPRTINVFIVHAVEFSLDVFRNRSAESKEQRRKPAVLLCRVRSYLQDGASYLVFDHEGGEDVSKEGAEPFCEGRIGFPEREHDVSLWGAPMYPPLVEKRREWHGAPKFIHDCPVHVETEVIERGNSSLERVVDARLRDLRGIFAVGDGL